MVTTWVCSLPDVKSLDPAFFSLNDSAFFLFSKFSAPLTKDWEMSCRKIRILVLGHGLGHRSIPISFDDPAIGDADVISLMTPRERKSALIMNREHAASTRVGQMPQAHSYWEHPRERSSILCRCTSLLFPFFSPILR